MVVVVESIETNVFLIYKSNVTSKMKMCQCKEVKVSCRTENKEIKKCEQKYYNGN